MFSNYVCFIICFVYNFFFCISSNLPFTIYSVYISVLLLFMILNSHQMSPNFLVRASVSKQSLQLLSRKKWNMKLLMSFMIYEVFILFVALVSAWCFLDGYNVKDVCNMSTTSSTGPSSCSSSQWPSWSHRTTVAYASIDSTGKPRASAGSQTSAGTSWSGVWWSRFVCFFHNINSYFVSN
jgi:hypothetical protein